MIQKIFFKDAKHIAAPQGEVPLIWCCSDLEVAWERALFYIQPQFYGMGYLLV